MSVKKISDINKVYSRNQTKDLLTEIKELRDKISQSTKDLTRVKKASNATNSPYLTDRPDFDESIRQGSLRETSWKTVNLNRDVAAQKSSEISTKTEEDQQEAYNRFYKKKLNIL